MTSTAPFLVGRQHEVRVLEQLVAALERGDSRSMVVRGEPGVGKTALLETMIQCASGCDIARAGGTPAEARLAFSGLHRLVAPMLGALDELAAPQRETLAVAFGMQDGPEPDPLLAGLATLRLLSTGAHRRPLICVLDDAQWLDAASVQTMAFVARRLSAEPVAVVFGARDAAWADELAGLPQLTLAGLSTADAQTLLRRSLRGPVDPRVRARILGEARGNPRTLVELTERLTAAQLGGGFGPIAPVEFEGSVEHGFARELGGLAPDVRHLLLLVAAEPTGDPTLIWRAADRLGLVVDPHATGTDMMETAGTLRFRHPLARSAVYRAASPAERRRAHAALAAAADDAHGPEWRTWHRAHAATGADEALAAELVLAAADVRPRGGLPAAAVLLDHAAELSTDRDRRAARALEAAEARQLAGAFEPALAQLTLVQSGAIADAHRARADLIRGRVELVSGNVADAPELLLAAAERFSRARNRRAVAAALELVGASLLAGAQAHDDRVEQATSVARRAEGTGGADPAVRSLLLGLAALAADDHHAAARAAGSALRVCRTESPAPAEALSWRWIAGHVAPLVWDFEAWEGITAHDVRLARDAGALGVLPLVLLGRVGVHVLAGRLDEAAAVLSELTQPSTTGGDRACAWAANVVSSLRGRDAQRVEMLPVRPADSPGLAGDLVRCLRALHFNALGRYEQAAAAAQEVRGPARSLWFSNWAAIELVEAAARTGDAPAARRALRTIAETARPGETDWGRGTLALALALAGDDEAAEERFVEAIERLADTGAELFYVRARLLYGEWLRRRRRRVDAREQLRIAYEAFTVMGFETLAERAEREMIATSPTARRRSPDTVDQLTPQETRVAQLARDGLTNPQIARQLFLSPRTVEYHLGKVFGKLGVTSRYDLDGALGDDAAETTVSSLRASCADASR